MSAGRMAAKVLVAIEKALRSDGRKSLRVESFGASIQLRNGKHLEIGFIDRRGYVFVDGVKVWQK